jgi:hypothetical protein
MIIIMFMKSKLLDLSQLFLPIYGLSFSHTFYASRTGVRTTGLLLIKLTNRRYGSDTARSPSDVRLMPWT